ncbi:FliA/WhiG family RNA polymerase sigma factor [Nocardioides sp.]|uniref:sigma-70 family RNA polymerase sigma factor n=1 Tax=Nocardioides sp. TaxID=35761 RepID=UPI00260E3B0C|nr:FliA/WhiG family RNA polymerase sigma factor [Nocardioides sp.]
MSRNDAASAIDITEHLPLVGHLVRETLARVPSHVDRDDLTSAGMMALVQASTSYDATRGVPFDRYAARRIRGAILDELRSTDWASRRVRRTAREIETTRAELSLRFGRIPTPAEVAAVLGINVEDVASNDDDINRAHLLSLQGSAFTSIEDLLPSREITPEQAAERSEQLSFLRHAIAELPERLRAVVEGYFLAARPMSEIAAELDVTDSRISQMRSEALVLLQSAMQRVMSDHVVPAPRPAGIAERRRAAYVAAVAARIHAEQHRSLPRTASAS